MGDPGPENVGNPVEGDIPGGPGDDPDGHAEKGVPAEPPVEEDLPAQERGNRQEALMADINQLLMAENLGNMRLMREVRRTRKYEIWNQIVRLAIRNPGYTAVLLESLKDLKLLEEDADPLDG